MYSRGSSYLTFVKLILHLFLLLRPKFKRTDYSVAHSDEPLLQFVCLSMVMVYSMLLSLALQMIVHVLLEQRQELLHPSLKNNSVFHLKTLKLPLVTAVSLKPSCGLWPSSRLIQSGRTAWLAGHSNPQNLWSHPP